MGINLFQVEPEVLAERSVLISIASFIGNCLDIDSTLFPPLASAVPFIK